VCVHKHYKQILIIHSPGVQHLWELKEVIFSSCSNIYKTKVVNNADCMSWLRVRLGVLYNSVSMYLSVLALHRE